jgi:hypothetical protein
MSKSFCFRPGGPNPTLVYRETNPDGSSSFEQTFQFEYVFGAVAGSDIHEQILVPVETEYIPREVMQWIDRRTTDSEGEYSNLTVAPMSQVELFEKVSPED